MAEFIKKQLNCYLLTLVEIKWEARFDALQQINNIFKNSQGLSTINKIVYQCEFSKFDFNEVQLINE